MYYQLSIVILLFPTLVDVNGLPAQERISLHIIGGTIANFNDLSYQCSLWNGTKHFCAGSLLSNEWVVTAAHCMGKMGPYKVRVKSARSDGGGLLVDVVADFKHPYFNELYSYDYDVALINIKPFDSTGIRFAKLPGCSSKKCVTELGTMITVSGWGVNNITNRANRVKLQKISVPVVDLQECKKIYKTKTEITPRMFCCGYKKGGMDSCQGDSGGPAVCNGNLVGIVSAGTEDCGLPNRPGLYTDITDEKIRKFIYDKTHIGTDCSDEMSQFNDDMMLQSDPSALQPWVR